LSATRSFLSCQTFLKWTSAGRCGEWVFDVSFRLLL